jgi:hypothetical protein
MDIYNTKSVHFENIFHDATSSWAVLGHPPTQVEQERLDARGTWQPVIVDQFEAY